MLAASLPLGLGIYGVFMPPEGLSDLGLVLWLLFFVVLTRTIMTFYYVPWAAIAAELTDDYHERTSVMAYRFAVGWTIGVSFPVFVYSFVMPGTPEFPVAQLNPAGYPMLAFCAAILRSGGALATTWLTLREVPYLRQHVIAPKGFPNPIKELVRALQTKQFSLIFVILLVSATISGSTRNLDIYIQTFFWGLATEDLRWFALSAMGAVLAFPLVAGIQRRWDKKQILILVSCLSLFDGMFIICLRFLDVLPQNGEPLLLIILVSAGVLAAGLAVVHGIIGASVIADTLDAHELRTGHRQEGMFNAAFSFAIKASSGLGIVMGGFVISAIQFPTGLSPTEVPGEIISRLGLVVGIAIPLLHIIPIAMLTRYTLTREEHARIRGELDDSAAKVL
jgi:Na+/melibiose symporter-like transporter